MYTHRSSLALVLAILAFPILPQALAAQSVYRQTEWMVYVEGDMFRQGASDGSTGPQRDVILNSFLIAKREVTFDEYDEFCLALGRERPDDHGWGRWSRPVINVTWRDAVEYCNWRSKKDGLTPAYMLDGPDVICDWGADGYRLPTEAEWEFAARGGKTSHGFPYPGGSDPASIGWCAGASSGQTHPVGEKIPNELGLYDMGGNVCEWCWDWYEDYPAGLARNPRGPFHAELKVMRGGSWFTSVSSMRPDKRFSADPEGRFNIVGFRLARSVPVKK